MNRVPNALRAGITALFIALGVGGGAYVVNTQQTDLDKYVATAAADSSASTAVKIAMVMGSFYESSYRHIGTPYIDKLGRGRPLTVCNGITGVGVVLDKYYTPGECYELEKVRYLKSEATARASLRYWNSYTDLQKATFIDFIHNKGEPAFMGSTMRARANRGDVYGACMENERWNKGTVDGVLTVLPGLDTRGKSNADICAYGLV